MGGEGWSVRSGRWTFLMAIMLGLGLWGRSAAQDGPRTFSETGHVLDNQYGFLAFWEVHAGPELFGPPLTGIVFEANVPVQYFERGRLEARDGVVVAGALGRERTRWRVFPAARAATARPGERFFPETGHTLAGPFLRFWEEHDGAAIFGAPLSEALWEVAGGASVRVQYFERGRLEQGPASTGGAIAVSALGREIALARGLLLPDQRGAIAIGEVSGTSGDRPVFEELAPPTPTPIPPTPTPVPPTATLLPPTATSPAVEQPSAATREPKPVAPAATLLPLPSPTATTAPAPWQAAEGGKVIDVDLSAQWLSAYENGELVYRAPVATGKDGFDTPTGTFDVYSKVPLRTMRGSLNGETWTVPNVPNVMYIDGMVALHGTYWHNKFGTGVRMSHGCVNLSLADAAWLYEWAPVGTIVHVHH